MDLKNISTAELVRELSNREGVEKIARSFLWVPQEAMEAFIVACYQDICSGNGIHAVLEHMGIYETDLPLLHSCGLWKILMRFMANDYVFYGSGYKT